MHIVYQRQGASNDLPPSIERPSVESLVTPGPIASAIPTTSTSSLQPTITASSTASMTAATSEPSTTSSNGLPPGVIAAIVVPIVIVVLVAPVILYFCLTRHDRQKAPSRASGSRFGSRINSRTYPDLTALSGSRSEVRSPSFRDRSLDTQHLKASEIMNFDLGPTVEKPLPLVNISGSNEDDPHRPLRLGRFSGTQTSEKNQGPETPIGVALSHYPGSHDSLTIPVHLLHNKTSVQGLSDENLRIARLATDSLASLRGHNPADRVSEISAPDERTSRHVGGRELDEISDVSSLQDDDSDTLAITDHGGNILRQPGAKGNSKLR